MFERMGFMHYGSPTCFGQTFLIASLQHKALPMERRPWCEGFDLYRDYHDKEWGVPLRRQGAV